MGNHKDDLSMGKVTHGHLGAERNIDQPPYPAGMNRGEIYSTPYAESEGLVKRNRGPYLHAPRKRESWAQASKSLSSNLQHDKKAWDYSGLMILVTVNLAREGIEPCPSARSQATFG